MRPSGHHCLSSGKRWGIMPRFDRRKVGWLSEGYTPQMAAVVRGEKLREIRHGDYLPKTSKNRLTMKEAWKAYDKWLAPGKSIPRTTGAGIRPT